MLLSSQIPYGVKDFKRVRLENRYYIDKTGFIRALEERADFLFFVRPRRFGKSMLCEMLRCYYDVAEKENFARLFGGTEIGANPTNQVGRFFVLSLDFSYVGKYEGGTWNERFDAYMRVSLDNLILAHREQIAAVASVEDLLKKTNVGEKYEALVAAVRRLGFGFYVIVDEYDNFTNEIASTAGTRSYKEITHGTGFYRGWFKAFKGTCDRIFMTGVSPVTMDDLTSGFNIATNISLAERFNAMVGFTEAETRKIFEDFQGCGRYQGDVEGHLRTVKAWYDSYCFSERMVGRETLYNCDMVLYYLGELVATGEQPRKLIDGNIRSDWSKMRTILAAQRHAETYEGVLPLTEELADVGEVTFDLVDSFPIEQICDAKNFKSLYYYYGIVTMGRVDFDEIYFRVPNECVRQQIFEHMRSEYEKGDDPVDLAEFSRLFRDFAREGAWKGLLSYLAGKYRTATSIRDGIRGEARINGFMRAYLTMKHSYLVRPELEVGGGYADYVLLPNPHAGLATPSHSYVIELKYAKAEASEGEVARKHEEALAQLRKYASDPALAALAQGTPVHYICYEFKGRDMVRLEEVEV